MTTATIDTPSVERDILDAIFQKREPALVVDSPPGAGKTYLNESIAALGSLEFGDRVALLTPKREQTYELVERLRGRFPRALVQLLVSSNVLPPNVQRSGARLVDSVDRLAQEPSIVVATVDKFTHALPRLARDAFGLVVVDEAYQTTFADAMGAIAGAWQVVTVGDPGQLRPFNEIPDARFESALDFIHHPLPFEIVRRFPNVPRFALGVTRRLPRDTVPFVRPFYPNLEFDALATDEERRLSFAARGLGDPVDRALDAIAAGASIIVLELPPATHESPVDPELSRLAARVAKRIFERGGRWMGGTRALRDSDIGYCDTHVVSGTETRAVFDEEGIEPIFADTPEVVQGREASITIVKHPLSGMTKASAFDVESGRLCVMISRHKLACIVVTRAGVPEVLRRYEHDSSGRRVGRHDEIWDGYVANRTFYDLMGDRGRIIEIPA